MNNEMKRYTAEYSAWSPVTEEYESRKAFSVQDDSGQYVLYADAQRALDQEREKVRKLREALEAIIKRVALVSPYYEQARAALSDTEG